MLKQFAHIFIVIILLFAACNTEPKKEAKKKEVAKKEAIAVAKQSKKDAIIMENEVEETDEPDDDLIPEVKPILEDVLAFAYSLLTEMYEKGKDLTGTPLKVFSGEALETFSRQIIEHCFTVIGIASALLLEDADNGLFHGFVGSTGITFIAWGVIS